MYRNLTLIWRSFTYYEKLSIAFFGFLIAGSSIALLIQFYYANTKIAPARGGTYIEGAFDIPRFINPALAHITDADRDITRLVYAGLMKYTKEGRIVEDLAETFSIENEKRYVFTLKNMLFWHDGKPLTAEDVVFTIKLIQDPKYASPIRLNWQGVEVEKIDERTVAFSLANPYSPFLENATVGVLPKHIWENVSPKSFPLAEANLRPIGAGPYRFEKFQNDSAGNMKSYSLKMYERYYGAPPSIEHVTFKFFESEEEGLSALKRNEIMGMSFVSGYASPEAQQQGEIAMHTFSLPRYFAVFFNQQKSKVLGMQEVRRALALATNRQELIETAVGGKGNAAFGPIIRELLGYNPQIEERYPFSLEQANTILDEAKWKDTNADGIREKKLGTDKDATPLEINLITVEWPELERTIRVLKDQWEKIGVKISINVYTLGEIQQDFIRPREYEAIVFGQVVGIDPDPFSFWHSSQKKDPGLNLALYDNKNADKLLEETRQTLNAEVRAQKYVLFQNLILDDMPAIFLYSPAYLYPVHKNVKGVKEGKIADPSWRFSDINEWYIDTKRVWK